jgi:formylglycine-generating enzyme required for sulfatase activity
VAPDLNFVAIAPGEFTMGGTSAREETPAHKVKITRGFEVSATEVTRGQWKAVMGMPPLDLPGADDSHPVVGVTWFEAVEFGYAQRAGEGSSLTAYGSSVVPIR